MYTASCLCAGIQFNIEQDILNIYICHCKQCQKAQGSAFVAIALVEKKNIVFTQGEDLINEYFAIPTKKRLFCKNCASPLYSARTDLPDVVRLRVGVINEELHAKIFSHAFTQYKACWFQIPKDGSQVFLEKFNIQD